VRNILRTTVRFLPAFLVFAALALAGDEPWKRKAYEQWNDNDLQKIFTDSPWSGVTTVTRTWLPLSAADFPEKPISGADRKLLAQLEQSGETIGVEVPFKVYWTSYRVMRAASARKTILHGHKKDVDVEKYANEPQDEYQIVVQSADMAPFVRKDEKFIQSNSFLQIKKSKLKISPSHIRYERDEKGALVTSAVFFFPKKTVSGEPTIASDEKNVEFNCKIEGSPAP
jgi:hypothetical protein